MPHHRICFALSARRYRFLAALGLPMLLVLSGCGEQAQITSYEVVKPKDDSQSVRMIAAMIPKGTKTWFFKLTGPDEAVKEQTEKVLELITSVRFPVPGSPAWDLPENWTQEGAGARGRFATIKVPSGDSNLELTVTGMATLNSDYEQWTLDNINRWRGQLGLVPVSKEELKEQVVKVPTADAEAVVVNLLGEQAAGGTMQPPFAGGGPFSGGGTPPKPPAQPTASASRSYHDIPKDWVKVATVKKQFSDVIDTFEVKDGDSQAEITTSKMRLLPERFLLANVNRWRNQLGLPPIAEDQVQDAFSAIEIGDMTARFLRLENDSEAMRVAVLNHAGATWYFKMMGDKPVVTAQDAAFRNFVKSVRFSPDEEAGDE